MSAPPPPPPMPPGMGRGAGGPPPPPPLPGKGAPGMKPPSGASRGALLSDINKGSRLKKVTQVNDRSAPQVGKVSDAPPRPGGAPPVPGMARPPAPPSGLAPPAPASRVRSNSDTNGAAAGGAPQLAGILAGGIPKLRKVGGVATGADSSSPYLSDPETSRVAPRPPRAAAPKPPGQAPPLPGARPPANATVSALRNKLRPASIVSTASAPDIGAKPRPPPPVGKKPPIPPPTSRKPSGVALTPPAALPARPPPVPGAAPAAPPPPAPSSAAPPVSAPRAPPSRSTPPPPPPLAPPPNGHAPSLAAQAARNALGRISPSAPPPAPPPPPSATSPPPASAPPPPPPPSASPLSRPPTQPPSRSMLDASAYTLTNGGAGSVPPSATAKGDRSSTASPGQHKSRRLIHIPHLRFRFQDDNQLPKPRDFVGGAKQYRAGRGSSVPLDLEALES